MGRCSDGWSFNRRSRPCTQRGVLHPIRPGRRWVLVADGLVGDTERHLLACLRVPVGDVRCACGAFCPGVPPMSTVFIAVVCQLLRDFVAGKRFDAFGGVLAPGDDEFVSILAGFDRIVDGLRVDVCGGRLSR